MIDSYLIPYQMSESTLIRRSQARRCGSADIHRRHVCLPHDAVWCHPSHHCIVKARSTSASHPNIPTEPITLAHLPPRRTILAFLQILATGMFNLSSCVGDVHGGHRDMLRGDRSVENEILEWCEARKIWQECVMWPCRPAVHIFFSSNLFAQFQIRAHLAEIVPDSK